MIDADSLARAKTVLLEDELARRGVKLRGTIERVGPCPVCGGTDRFAINTRKQIWNCRWCSKGGDVIALVQHVDGAAFADAIETLTGASIKRPQVARHKTRRETPDQYERRQASKASYLWLQRYPIKGSPAETYLREARRYSGPLPATLGYLEPGKPKHHPAMIAAFGIPDEPEPGIVGEPRGVAAVHLTLLKPDGSGKADVKPNKLIIGRPLGRPIILAPPNDLLGLAITEGIEDALSVHQSCGLGAWAAGAAGFMPKLAEVVPDYIEVVHILVDDDEAGFNNGSELLRRLRARRGFEVIPKLLRPSEAAPSADANSILRENGDDALREAFDNAENPFADEKPQAHERAKEPRDNGKANDEGAHGPNSGTGTDKPKEILPPLPYIDMSTWDTDPVPEQEWTVHNRIPRRHVTLFSGEGSAGKSTIDLHASAAHVLGRDWLGTMPEQGPAIFIDAEDDEGVMHRRLAAIAKHYGVTFSELIKSGLRLVSLAGEDAVLAAAGRNGKITPTPRYKRLLEEAGDVKPISISIASCANVYAGSEIDRNQVQQFITLLTKVAIVANGSVKLISHPSLSGISSGSGLSGNTQWHNAVRARSYLKGIKPDDEEEPDNDLREIVFKKNNYGPVSETIVLRYTNGLFLPVPGINSLDRAAREAKADDIFLALLQRFSRDGINVTSTGGQNNAARLFALEPEAKAERLKKEELADAMRRLLSKDRIHNELYRKNGEDRRRVAIGPRPTTLRGEP